MNTRSTVGWHNSRRSNHSAKGSSSYAANLANRGHRSSDRFTRNGPLFNEEWRASVNWVQTGAAVGFQLGRELRSKCFETRGRLFRDGFPTCASWHVPLAEGVRSTIGLPQAIIAGLLEGAGISLGAPILERSGQERQPSPLDGHLQQIINIVPNMFSVGGGELPRAAGDEFIATVLREMKEGGWAVGSIDAQPPGIALEMTAQGPHAWGLKATLADGRVKKLV
jgi:hypothetical protein